MGYQDFAEKPVSEKITLAWVEPSERVSARWALFSGSVYVFDSEHFVVGVSVDGTTLTAGTSSSLSAGQFFFDAATKKLYVRLSDSSSPKLSWTLVTYRLFFTDAPLSLPYDLDAGFEVPYEPLLAGGAQGGSRFDPDSLDVAVEGSGSLSLHNEKEFFKPIFDRYTWQNKRVRIFSYSKTLLPSEARKLFDGSISTQSYSQRTINFGLKDFVFKLRSTIDLPLYSAADGTIPDSLIGKPKRRVYGRVSGLQAESLDQQLLSYKVVELDVDGLRTPSPITFDLTTASSLISASSADVHRELCAQDRLEIADKTYRVKTLGRVQIGLESEKTVTFTHISGATVELSFTDIDTSQVSVGQFIAIGALENGTSSLLGKLRGIWPVASKTSTYIRFTLDATTSFSTETFKATGTEICVVKLTNDTSFYVSETAPSSLSDYEGRVKPETPYRRLNRRHQIAGHALHEVNTAVELVRRGNSFVLDDVSQLSVGDLVVFDGTKVDTLTYVNQRTRDIRTTNLINPLPFGGESVVRVPVQRVVFKGTDFVPLRDYTVSNLVAGATLTFSLTAERDVTPTETIGTCIWRANAKAVISLNGDFASLKVRDWIQTGDGDWYEISEVLSDRIVILVEPYAGTSGTKSTVIAQPTYIEDKSKLYIDTYGITHDNTPTGTLVKTSADASLHALKEAGITEIDEDSFAEGSESCPYLISVCLPKDPSSEALGYRGLLNRLNSSTLSTVFVGSDYELKFGALTARRLEADSTLLTDYVVIKDAVKANSTAILSKVVANFRFQDLDEVSEEKSNLSTSVESAYVRNQGIAGQVKVFDLYLYNEAETYEIASRILFMNELPQLTLELTGKLNLNLRYLNDLIVYQGDSLFERYGSADKAFVGIVTDIKRTGIGGSLTVSDLGNVFNRVAVVSPDDTPSHSGTTAETRRFASFITDDSGTVDDDNSLGSSLIG